MATPSPETIASLTPADIEVFMTNSIASEWRKEMFSGGALFCASTLRTPMPMTFRWKRTDRRTLPFGAIFKFVQRSRGKGRSKRWKMVER